MKLPVPKNHKYGLIALDGAAEFEQPIDLENGYFAPPARASGTSRSLEGVERPEVLDGDNEVAGRRVDNLFWGLLAAGHLRVEGEGRRTAGSPSWPSLTPLARGPSICSRTGVLRADDFLLIAIPRPAPPGTRVRSPCALKTSRRLPKFLASRTSNARCPCGATGRSRPREHCPHKEAVAHVPHQPNVSENQHGKSDQNDADACALPAAYSTSSRSYPSGPPRRSGGSLGLSS